MATKTIEELIAALQKADAAGDQDAADAIAAEIKRVRAAPAPDEPAADTADTSERRNVGVPAAIVHGITQGATLGFGDEAAAGLSALFKAPFSERTMGEIYDERLGEERADLEEAKEAAPWMFHGSQLAAALAPTAKIVKGGKALASRVSGLAQAARNIPNWLKIAGLGGAEGAVFGAGTADGGSPTTADLVAGEMPTSRTRGAVEGGLVGAVAAPVIGAVAKPVISGVRNAASGLRRALTATPRREAERLVSGALADDAVDPLTLTNMAKNQNMVLADAGENVGGLARWASSRPGSFRADASRTLHGRQAGQQGRLLEAAGTGERRSFKDNFDDWIESRITEAKPKYDEAYAASLDLTSPQMRALLQRPAMQQALRAAATKLKNEGGQQGHVAVMDAAKRALDDDIGAAIRTGRNDEARVLQSLKRSLVDEMDRQVPAYGQARKIFSDEASLRGAADMGTDLFKRSTSHDAMRRTVADMTETEREAFRRGAIRGLIDMLERTPENRNAAQNLINSTAVREKLALAFPDEAAAQRFIGQAADEAQMSWTKNLVLGGSPTARIQAEQKTFEGMGSFVRDLVTGNHLGAFGKVLRFMGYGDVSEDTLEELSRLLLTRQSPGTVGRLGQSSMRALPKPVSQTSRTVVGGTGGGLFGIQGAPPRGSQPAVQPQNAEEERRQRLAQGLR